MKKNNFGWFIFVVCVVLWALFEMYPPTSRDLIQQFTSRAENQDAAFTNILSRLQTLQQTQTNTEFANLQIAIGTNDIQNYFPFVSAKNQVNANLFVLNQLQRDASGRIKLGLDLQGGTSFLVEMNTNVLFQAETNSAAPREQVTSAALSQAIEVLRKRVDRFGVAEPVIQSAGGNRILIQLPGLSPSDKASALASITNTAYLEFRMVKDDSDEIIANHEPVPPGYVLLKHVQQDANGQSSVEQVVVKKTPENGLYGDIIESARVDYGNLGQPQIDFRLTPDGTKKFGEVTRNNVGHRLAIILDGELRTAPNIESPIETGSGQIPGITLRKKHRAWRTFCKIR